MSLFEVGIVTLFFISPPLAVGVAATLVVLGEKGELTHGN